MKYKINTVYFLLIIVVSSVVSGQTRGALVFTWRSTTAGGSWTDGSNWNAVDSTGSAVNNPTEYPGKVGSADQVLINIPSGEMVSYTGSINLNLSSINVTGGIISFGLEAGSTNLLTVHVLTLINGADISLNSGFSFTCNNSIILSGNGDSAITANTGVIDINARSVTATANSPNLSITISNAGGALQTNESTSFRNINNLDINMSQYTGNFTPLIDITGNLTVNTSGILENSDPSGNSWKVDGITTLNSTQYIYLNNASNDFAILTISNSQDTYIRDSGTVELRGINLVDQTTNMKYDFFIASRSIFQSASTSIVVGGLAIFATNTVTLMNDDTNNDIEELALTLNSVAASLTHLTLQERNGFVFDNVDLKLGVTVVRNKFATVSNLLLNVNSGTVTQNIPLDVQSIILSGEGNYILDNMNNNNDPFKPASSIASNSTGNINYRSSKNLTVKSLSITSNLQNNNQTTIDGISSTNSNSITLNAPNIAIENSISLSHTGSILNMVARNSLSQSVVGTDVGKITSGGKIDIAPPSGTTPNLLINLDSLENDFNEFSYSGAVRAVIR